MFKKLFSGLMGGGDKPSTGTRPAEPVHYQDYTIVSQPDSQGGQFRVSGTITKEGADGRTREHRFERSDMLPGREACDEMMVAKAKRYIDEVGEAMFEADPREASTP
ncbi:MULTISPECIES: HlyU family transcriptional regulator [unclassified Halomonas]|uniref:HlyU family transcriptional regulator n=1 Tax=unclassified Halomonas TaxID=2609666 RepID=UPI0020A1AD13|nr:MULTISPECIES: HlyU family transcriptional regulator [unclassified Halomonas]MCP1313376.1 HlyU family transcriptional regulator [Halomonas sp. 707D7]MCP1325371.1 HlyU family transcriptional regulator [Halomonas sp. 707D4]